MEGAIREDNGRWLHYIICMYDIVKGEKKNKILRNKYTQRNQRLIPCQTAKETKEDIWNGKTLIIVNLKSEYY